VWRLPGQCCHKRSIICCFQHQIMHQCLKCKCHFWNLCDPGFFVQLCSWQMKMTRRADSTHRELACFYPKRKGICWQMSIRAYIGPRITSLELRNVQFPEVVGLNCFFIIPNTYLFSETSDTTELSSPTGNWTEGPFALVYLLPWSEPCSPNKILFQRIHGSPLEKESRPIFALVFI
jgi:hypothetical protein